MLNWHHVFVHTFEVLAEPIRRRVVEVLCSGTHTTGDLEAIITHEFGVSRAAVHHHLRLLREHGVVTAHDDWPRVENQLDADFLDRLERDVAHYRWLHDRRIGWRERTDPPKAPSYSRRGLRGRGVDPDDPWVVATRSLSGSRTLGVGATARASMEA